ncbi:MAG: peptide chain release factor N(5)-glutamine methyltransferase [Clostridiales bacterium]|jgi:release factor glutamine methyltransferase|nr:peptide chain release factor N(5)-glutamine methyltransferase [Clostridiales bacterium]
MKSYKEVLEEGINHLINHKIDNGNIDAWYLFSHVFNIERAEYFLNLNKEVNSSRYSEFMNLIEKRASHVPLQYIIGYTEFMGLRIKVNENVLIPRHDTEVLVEEVLKVCDNKNILDMCTGSGCIIISLKKLANIKKAIGVDISKDAIILARENAALNEVDVEFIESDLFENIEGKFDIIVSNPPYIPKADIEDLSMEVRDHEPHLALDGKEDGLYFYRRIIKEVKKYLNPNGYVFFEIGYNQADDLLVLFKSEGIDNVEIIQDLAGLDRVVKARI